MPIARPGLCRPESPTESFSFTPRSGHQQLSLLIAFDLPTIPSPTTASPFLHDRFRTLLHRRELPRLSPGQTCLVRGQPSRGQGFAALPAGSPTGLAELSSLSLQTGRSLPGCSPPPLMGTQLHFQFQAGNVRLEGTCTLLIKRLHRRTRAFHDSVYGYQTDGPDVELEPRPSGSDFISRCTKPLPDGRGSQGTLLPDHSTMCHSTRPDRLDGQKCPSNMPAGQAP